MAGSLSGGLPSGSNNDNGRGNGLLLYFHHYSFYSQKVVMALHEKKLPFKTHLVNVHKGEQYDPWFMEINPKGDVPVLKDGVKIIPDSGRILDYLEDNFTNGRTPPLIPKDHGIEVRQRVLHFRTLLDQLPVNHITAGSFYHTDLISNPKLPFVSPFRHILKVSEVNQSNYMREHAENNPKFRDVLLQRADLLDKKHDSIINREEYTKWLKNVETVLAQVEDELASHNEDKSAWWLCSPEFSIADVALTVLLDRLCCLGLEERFWSGGKCPHLDLYFKKVKNRDSYKKAVPSTLIHLQLLLMMTPRVVGVSTCIVAALAVLVGGYFYLKRK
ncbi:Ganglioside-induced differentiation-associated protein 1 [Frankliniella fusca]|uniref:Ganglioside-induced differentiation-associated protein 1 n=1 Tax=Frankliniella fusca TaxID=407009 RepID=A0AAE1HM86_9NEOP|nr:Ganglioside-induced differentiation-associated protein 1 [Frankliniella fusca]